MKFKKVTEDDKEKTIPLYEKYEKFQSVDGKHYIKTILYTEGNIILAENIEEDFEND